EEFKERQTYDIASSKLKKQGACDCDPFSTTKKAVENPNELLIFTSKTCPNCKMAKQMLDKASIKYTIVDAEDDKEKTLAYGIKKAPTLLVPNGNNYDVYDNASKIKGYIEACK
ncbi:MAG: glutaredoxin domain-containing protein, partial [Clostridia bacterium]